MYLRSLWVYQTLWIHIRTYCVKSPLLETLWRSRYDHIGSHVGARICNFAHFDVYDGIWRYLELFGGMWRMWAPMGVCGGIWGYTSSLSSVSFLLLSPSTIEAAWRGSLTFAGHDHSYGQSTGRPNPLVPLHIVSSLLNSRDSTWKKWNC